MQNINRISQAGLLSCATIGLLVSIWPCFAQGGSGCLATREFTFCAQGLGTEPPEITTPFKCDSLDPQVCFDIYGRILKSTPWLFYGTVGGDGLPFSNEGWLSRWTAGTSVEQKFEYRPGTRRFDPAPPFK
jgi:hypothetical protein